MFKWIFLSLNERLHYIPQQYNYSDMVLWGFKLFLVQYLIAFEGIESIFQKFSSVLPADSYL